MHLTTAVFWGLTALPLLAQLPGTEALPPNPDFSATMVAGIDRMALRLIEASKTGRQPTHDKLKAALGLVEARLPFQALMLVGGTQTPPLLFEIEHYRLLRVRWPVFEALHVQLKRQPMSYIHTHEYEIWEWNMGRTFNYAEMAALIAPRPFMVERGHNDLVGTDEWVNYEFAKVRRLYNKLKIGERAKIEHFDGPQMIHGVGAFEFLKQQLSR